MPYPIVFFFYRIAYYLVRIAFFFYYRISFEGRENVPKGTAVIFASNHRSYLDPVLVSMAAPHPFNFIAKEPLFRNPISETSSDSWAHSPRRTARIHPMIC
ncbi:MAG: lysophospholipid acyltransferase family protein [Ruminococcus callidus]